MEKRSKVSIKTYYQQGVDLKRLVLVIGKKIWIAAAAAVIGAALGALLYQGITSITNGEEEYRISADYYITFDFETFEHGDDYYNAYTWDNVLRDDPIVDYALEFLPKEISKEQLKETVTGEMLGDYRILTVHVTSPHKEQVELIAEAYEKSLVHFGQSLELFKSIECWSKEPISLLEKNTKTANAALLGAVLLGITSLFVLLYDYLLKDAFYTEKELRCRFGLKVLGYETKNKNPEEEKRLQNNMQALKAKEIVLWKAEQVPVKKQWEEMADKDIVLLIPWGENIGSVLERLLGEMSLHSCQVAGCILTDTEDWFLKAYYGNGDHRAEIEVKGGYRL